MKDLPLIPGVEPYHVDEKAGIVLYCGDCRELLPKIPAGTVDLVLTDPPYGININADGCKKHVNPKFTETIQGDTVPFDPTPFLGFPRGCIWGATCFYDKLPPGQVAWLAWDRTTRDGLRLRNCEWEAAFAWPLRRSQMLRFMWQGAFRDGNRRRVNMHVHPTQKPVELMRWCMVIVGGGLVFDPYCGSGTTLVAAKLEGRRAIGIEIEEKYCEIAKRRLQATQLGFVKPGTLKHKPPRGFLDR